MITLLLATAWFGGIALGYWLGIGRERSRQRLRSAQRRMATPLYQQMPLRQAGVEPTLPDLSRWQRGGGR